MLRSMTSPDAAGDIRRVGVGREVGGGRGLWVGFCATQVLVSATQVLHKAARENNP